jgi:hypothetical protein
MTLTTASITLAGLTLEGAKDDKGNYYVLVPRLEETLEIRKDSTREICKSKGLEAFAGKALALGKKGKQGGGFVGVLSTKDFTCLLGFMATQGNTKAQAFLYTLAIETIERRIDHVLGVVVPEETREERRIDYFREICRKEFQPEFTEWLKYDENEDGRPANYALCVNQLKKAAKLPLDTVDVYDQEQLRTWSKAITSYGNYRELGMNHKLALQKVTLKFDKP